MADELPVRRDPFSQNLAVLGTKHCATGHGVM